MQAGISTNGLLDKHVETLIEYFDICSNMDLNRWCKKLMKKSDLAVNLIILLKT